MLLLVGPGIGTWGGYDDAGKFSSNLLETIWNIAHYADAWDTVKEHWSTILRFFITPLECDWKSVGRYAIAELGDEAPPPLSMARLAYAVGDQKTYILATSIFAKELVHHYVKQVGHHWFRLHQPWHSEEFIPEQVFLTNMWGDLAGWQMDGPTFPRVTGERQFRNRWVRFSSEEVGQFYRDYLKEPLKKELEMLTAEAMKDSETYYLLLRDTAHIAPSIVRLRALLLGEPAENLLALAPLPKWQMERTSDITAMSVPILRNAATLRKVTIIPSQRTGWQEGLTALRLRCEFPALALAVSVIPQSHPTSVLAGKPFLRWWGWQALQALPKTDDGAFWSFGVLGPVEKIESLPRKWREEWLNPSAFARWQSDQ
ncbi:MAG: hypothetical protein NZ959_04285 [Armatimonadetes bacterium]|nr:hypothetical protein [Armatimonadota bacterium]MDW8121428.1 hypothetical protein [Armatimonadota bacterium]